MAMSIEETIKRFQNNAEYERTHGNLQGCLEFKQLVEWLRKYQKIEEAINRLKNINDHTTSIDLLFEIKEIVEDGNR